MSRRAPVLVIVAALVAGGLADRQRRVEKRSAPLALQPAAASSSALSSTWYCTGSTAGAGGVADGNLFVANAGSRRLTGTVTVVSNQGEIRQAPIEIPAAARVGMRLQDVMSAPYVSALVELDGGQAVAELGVSGPLGPSAAPCASSASRRWYFAEGATTKDAGEVIAIFNPFPDDAIVDLSFGTEEGRVAPEALAGVVVKGRRMASINVGEHVHRRQVVATSVVARIGRVVAARLQSFDGTAGRKGVSLALGAPGPGRLWYFPDGLATESLIERYQIYNPFRREAVIEVEFALERGEAEPLELRIPPESRLTVSANSESRIPKGVPHATTVRVTGGEGVVAERTIDAGAPGRSGVAWALGSNAPARRWGFAAGGADETVDEWVSVQNPGSAPALVSLTLLADGQPVAVDGLQGVRLGPGQRTGWRIGDHVRRPATPMVVSATVPVVVERGLYVTRGPGTAMSMGIPL